MNLILITLVVLVLGWIHCFLKKRNNFFKNMGVPYVPPKLFFGNMGSFFFRREHITDSIKYIYHYNKNAKYIGAFDFVQPIFVIRDTELIKSVTIKNFDHFYDRQDVFEELNDPLFGNNLSALCGDKWRETRNLLTPAFTASKMKAMFELMVQCTENLTNYLSEQAKNPKNILDTKDLFSKYTVDIIGTCAFGIGVDSFKNPKNEFYSVAKESASFDGPGIMLKFILLKLSPKLMRWSGITLTSNRVNKFLTDLVKMTVETRDAKGIVRPDMIQLMMDARGKTSDKVDLNILNMTAQAFIFFLAGFEVTSTQMCIVSQLLVMNPDVQKRLQDEIDEVLKETNGKPTYEAINTMVYLDAVLNESLRSHVQTPILERMCRKHYELPPALPGAEPAVIKPGARVWIPVSGIHSDEKLYYNAEKFDPDRFLNKKLTINQTEMLSFGIGPRSCIGNRFAIMETKLLFFQLLANFNLKPNEKSSKTFEYKKSTFSIKPKEGYWLTVEPRNK